MIIHPDARLVVAATGQTVPMSAVDALTERFAALPTGILLATMPTTLSAVLNYLAALRADRPIALVDPAWPVADLVAAFRPAAILGDVAMREGYTSSGVRISPVAVTPHPDLAVLLATSGSTGSPKFVRLSRTAITTNAAAIAEVLDVGQRDVAITNLPLHYSYGMSVLNSHLLRGATVVIDDHSLLTRPFWQAVDDFGVTTLSGVPQHYRMLRRLKFDPADFPTLRTLTQAGGALAPDLVREFHTAMTSVGGRMFVMYGQTEAAPRMATLPSGQLPAKLGSVGVALPGGRFAISPDGEVGYTGPNVMLGYARTEADLARGDDCGGRLATGDLGRLDDDGYLTITGRMSRLGKVFGHRVSLDDVEHLARELGLSAVGAVPSDDRVVLYVEGADTQVATSTARALSDRLRVHVSGFDVQGIDSLPLLPSGKIDYRTLAAMCTP